MPPDGRRLLLDQNVPHAVADWLRDRLGDAYAVEHVTRIGLTGAPDPTIFAHAQTLRAIIVTFDEDFADRRHYPPGTHCGVVRLRIEPTTIEHTVETLARLFDAFAPEALFGKLTVVDERRTRILG